MKILVPCDFSPSSNNAALYAAKFAEKINAEIFLLHVVHFEHPPMVQVFGFIENEIEKIRLSDASNDCTRLVDEIKPQVQGVQVSFKVIPGFPVEDAIENYATTHKFDLIIMGTKGETGLLDKLFGSTTVAVINTSTIPVITVPQSASFSNVKLIVCASEMVKIESEIKRIIPFAKLFDASIDILHVSSSVSSKEVDAASIKNSLIEKHKYQKIALHIIDNNNTIEGIDAFITDVKADILAIHTHKIGFFESLFKTSISREEAVHSSIPLLILKDLPD